MLPRLARQTSYIAQALRAERLRPEEVARRQDRALRAVVHHAWTNSAFYRAKFRAAGLRPQDIRCVADLWYLPPTTKAELQAAAPESLLATGFSAENTVLEATSGSSGKVLQIHHSVQAYDRYWAFAFRHLRDLGYRPWDRVAYTAYDPLRPLPWERLGLGGRQQVDLRRRDPRAYVEDLLRIRPDVITAYPSILLLVIRTATPAELQAIRPRVIHLHSELLTAGIRAEISNAFDTDCYDDYSTFEFHHVAYECRQHTYHIAADNVVVEFVRDGQPVATGQEGEILLTGLTNAAMPLLRYAIGDVGAASTSVCACGRGFPGMQLVQGRVDDYITLPSGRCLSPRMVNPAFENLPGILEHVLVQEAADHIVAHLNVDRVHAGSTPPLVEHALRELFGEPIRLDIRLTSEIERSPDRQVAVHRVAGRTRMNVTVAASIRQLDEHRWDALAADQVVMTHRWQRVMESSRSAYQPRYLMVEDDGGPLLGLIANTTEAFGRTGWREAALRRLSLVVSAPFSSQHSGVIVRGNTPIASVLPVLEPLLGQLCWREQRVVVGVANVASGEVDEWRQHGFTARAQPVSMTLALPTSGYAAYLEGLSPGDRRELRRARRRAEAAQVTFAHAPLHTLERTEHLYPMFAEVCARHGGDGHAAPVSPALFASLEREMPGEVMVFSGSVDGQAAGYFLCLRQGQTLLVILAGLRYALAYPSSLYFVLLDEIVQWSLRHDVHTIHAGLTNETQKRRHGFKPRARWFCLRAFPGPLNRALHSLPLHIKDQ